MTDRLHELKARRTFLEQELATLNQVSNTTKGKRLKVLDELDKLNDSILNYVAPKKIIGLLKISDHATIRFMERFMKQEIALVQKKIVDDIKASINPVMNGKYPFKNGGWFVIKNGIVVTVMLEEKDEE